MIIRGQFREIDRLYHRHIEAHVCGRVVVLGMKASCNTKLVANVNFRFAFSTFDKGIIARATASAEFQSNFSRGSIRFAPTRVPKMNIPSAILVPSDNCCEDKSFERLIDGAAEQGHFSVTFLEK